MQASLFLLLIYESAEEVTKQQSTERVEQETQQQETQQPQSAISGESPELDLDFEPDVGVKRVAEMLRLYLPSYLSSF